MIISIALCTYNGEKYLREQLESIASQSLPPDELVICDDGSSDGTLEILEAFREKASFPVEIHRNEVNLGSTKNFEKAISLCQGEIVALSDQDDVWLPEKLEKIEAAFKANPEAGYVFSDAEVVDKRLAPLGHRLWESTGFTGVVRKVFENGHQLPQLLRRRYITGAAMAFKADQGKLAFPFPVDTIWIHDGWLAIFLTSIGACGVPLDDQLILYRQHDGQQVGIHTPERKTALVKTRDALKVKILSANEQIVHSINTLKARLQQPNVHSPVAGESIHMLDQYLLHCRKRQEILSSRGMARLKNLTREAASGRYGLFANSWKTVIRDILLS